MTTKRYAESRSGLRLTRYLIGASAARVATEGVAIALVLLVRATGGGASLEGLFVAAWSGPSLLSGAVVGHGLDRSPHPRRFLMEAGLLAATCLGLDAALVGRVPTAALLAITSLGGVTIPLFTGGMSSLLPGLVEVDDLGAAQALDSATYSVAGIAGPAGVALLASVWPRLGLVAPAVALALGAGAMPITRAAVVTRISATRPSLAATARALANTPQLLRTTIASSIAAFGWGGLEIGAAAVAVGLGSARLAGLYLATIAAGALTISLGLARRPTRHPERAIVASLIVMTTGGSLIAVARTPLVAAAGFVVFGAGDGSLLPAVLAIRSRDAPRDMNGAVFTAAASLKTAASATGAAVAGAAVSALGDHGLFLGIAATQLLAGAVAAPTLARAPGNWSLNFHRPGRLNRCNTPQVQARSHHGKDRGQPEHHSRRRRRGSERR